MKLSKQQETEIIEAYKVYFDSYINGDVKTVVSLLDDDYNQIGSAETEVFFNKEDAAKFLHDTIDQIAGKTEIRNRIIKVDPLEDLILVTDLFDIYALMEDSQWSFYAKFRASTLMQKKDDVWKFIHQHSSMPDTRTEEGDNIAIEKVNAENLQLREAVKRRTVELEQKNRELEIESSLERVRARSMAMHKSEELAALSLELVKQVQALGVATWFCAFNIYDDDQKGSLEWGSNGQGTFPKYRTPREGVFLSYYEAGQSGETLLINEIDENECPSHYEYLCSLPGVGDQLLKMKNDGIPFPTSQIDHAAFFKYGYILFITFEPAPEAYDIFKRFAKVFEQTYTRFLDLQKAEAQTHEAQIEIALERVRSRTMAMHKSEDLSSTITTVFSELDELGFKTIRCGIGIFNDKSKKVNVWTASDGAENKTAQLSGDEILEGHPLLDGIYDAYENQRDYSYVLEGEDLKSYYDIAADSNLPVSGPKANMERAAQYYHCVMFPAGGLFALKDSSFTEEAKLLMKRFADVFHLTFIRHLDLMKAEAQAREAQIEAALEKVRSQSMGMQTSQDLSNVTNAMFEQLRMLGGELYATGIVLCDKQKGHVEQWHSLPEAGMLTPFIVPIDLDKVHQYRYDQWKKGTELFSIVIEEGFIEQHFKTLFQLPTVKIVLENFEARGTPMPTIPSWEIDYGASFKYGYLLISALKPFEEKQILPRFAKVFEQTYTRFLDLQKAEAQTRESQIDLALERVRARAMSMQKSDELSDLVGTVFTELTKLDFALSWCIINIIDEPNKSNVVWGANTEAGKPPESYFMKFEDHRFHHEMMKAYQERKGKWVFVLEGDEKRNYDDYLFTDTEFRRVSKKVQQEMRSTKRYIASFTFSSFGGLQTIGEEPLSEENLNILNRFGKVFDLTYTRFNDLLKAEAQAREARIEAALEKVRSRSIGMQKSEELKEVIQVIHDQLIHLNFEIDAAGFTLDYHQNNDWNTWIANKSASLPSLMFIPYIDHPQFNYYKTAKEKGLDFLANTLSFEEKNSIFNYMFGFMGDYPQAERDEVLRKPGLAISQAFLNNISLWIYNLDAIPYSKEDNNTLMRFAKVFQQTYTRFLDLKKSEEQAREAQIEAVLERVRSRTMAMQQSEEMPEVANNLFLQVKELGFPAWSAGYCIWEKDNNSASCSMSSEGVIQKSFSLPTIGEGYDFLTPFKNGKQFYHSELGGEALVEHYNFMRTLPIIGEIIEDFKKKRIELPTFQIFHIVYFKHGYLMFITYEPVTEAHDIFKRFAKVFEQTYTRFLDLKQAEAQAREAQIQLALEKVRMVALGLNKSIEMLSVAKALYEQLVELGFSKIRNAIIDINNGDSDTFTDYDYSHEMSGTITQMSYHDDPTLEGQFKKMASTTNDFFELILEGEELDDLEKMRLKNGEAPDARLNNIEVLTYNLYSFGNGAIGISNFGLLSAEEKSVLNRFSNVFTFAYKRYIDMVQAEYQAREAQIEVALERSRTQSMLMKHSDELDKTSQVFHEQLQLLGIDSEFSYLWLPNEVRKEHLFWATWNENKNGSTIFKNKAVTYPLDKKEPSIVECYLAWESGESVHVNPVAPNEVENYFATWEELLSGVDKFRPELFPEGIYYVDAYMKYGCFGIMIKRLITEDEKTILSRFTIEFERAYTRFLDLIKAEAQARNAEIEAALERVRSKTMAMHNSEDMGNTVLTLFHEVLKLGLDDDIRCGIGILEGSELMETRSATLDSKGEVDLKMGMLDMTIHPMLVRIKEAWESGGTHFIDQMTGEDVIRYYTALNNEPDYPFFVDLDTLPETQFHNSFSFSEGILFAFSPNLMSEEATKVLDRFARVFGQTYRRFRDLQKAEAQTREAKIEASLERIRSQAMAMQHSNDLVKSTTILFEEFEKLQLSVDRCGIGIFDAETRDCQLYTTVTTHDGKTELATGITSLTVHPMLIETFEAWESQRSLQYILEGKELEDYYELVSKSEFHLPSKAIENSASLPKEYYLYTPFGAGGLYVFSAAEPAKEEKNIIRRFAEVFHLTYTRYEDLQKAEARALEAVKQASLDRVRGEIASMRTSEDLKRITPLIWSELEILEVPFIRCGAFMIDERNSSVQAHLTTSDGKPIGALNLPFDANDLTSNTVEHWRKKKVYTHHWNKEDFVNWMKSMVSLGQIQTPEQYQGSEKPPETLDLHFIPFKQGMLYVGNIEPLLPEKIDSVKTLAKAFSIAYARYEDFVNLEEAKTRVEKTLNELKSAQTQLIHSEKMASLGELTAGIAHEIQNPLNFVNNFSDVSVDLIEEMDEEMTLGNTEEVKDIASDLKQNLEKILHHGKRASFIVQGMLEHSRTNPGDKKPTDINLLADEFLRLSYHGLRAKDKTFNAEIITEFEKDLPEISVIPQDFGRVLLNLVNNAFYAVAEKQKMHKEEYKPSVSISTSKIDDEIEIRVKDNGNGIPDEVLKKIFQPFFTTKPTGEGTGLGLSMSYDIITKGHGGKLEVETKEGEGTTFIINIPTLNT